jgi:hypothetical protein
VCDFNTLLSSTDRSSKIPPKNQQRKIRDKVCHISNGLNTHLQLSNLFQLPCMEYTFFSAIRGTCSKIYHISIKQVLIQKKRNNFLYQTIME